MSDQLQQQSLPQQPHQLQRLSPTCCRWSFFYKGRRRKITPISTMSPSHRHHHHPRWCSSKNYYRWITLIHVLFLVILEGYCIEVASSARLPDIYWNSSNPMWVIWHFRVLQVAAFVFSFECVNDISFTLTTLYIFFPWYHLHEALHCSCHCWCSVLRGGGISQRVLSLPLSILPCIHLSILRQSPQPLHAYWQFSFFGLSVCLSACSLDVDAAHVEKISLWTVQALWFNWKVVWRG